MKKILFCTEKWCAADPKMGLTNNFENLFNTFSQYSEKYIFDTLHIDECLLTYKSDINSILINYCKNFQPDLIIFCLLGGFNCNPSINSLLKLKSNGIKLCFMWPDTPINIITNEINSLCDIADISISWDNPTSVFHKNYKFPDNHMFLWVPQNNNLFFNEDKLINVSFVGSTIYPDRNSILKNILSIRNDIYIAGGQRTNRLSPEKYAQIIRSSKISINFALSPCQQYYQTKGRVYEILASSSLLLESKNPSTSKLFIPNEDYIEFDDVVDLNDKINYYLSHDEDRIKIATNGNKKYNSYYTSNYFWSTIFNKVNL